MKSYLTVIIGAGQCGLAMSHVLSERSVDHVILERGEVATSWRTERWNSLLLLTPNWQSRLPGCAYGGPDSDGYMIMPELIRLFETYSLESATPIVTGAAVQSVVRTETGYRIEPTRVPASPRLEMDLTDGGISSVLWVTGYRPNYSWLQMPALDRKGRLRHDGGIVDSPGLFAMGLPFMGRRKSTLIDGAGADAYDLSDHVIAHLDQLTGLTVMRKHAA